ncbi:MAG: hypothetical protein JSS20_16430 [Proteobacteria bacterium]|nr:hypothetical protein [Pseudomonadota bacterium]
MGHQMFLKRYFAAVSLAGALITTAAKADDLKMCIYENGDVAIEACNRAINSGQYSGTDLANAYINRGAEWLHKKDYDRCISDENVALKLYPKSTLAYNARASCKAGKGNFEAALADATSAIEIDRNNPGAYNTRASFREKNGDIKGARADYQSALKTKPREGKFRDVDTQLKIARESLARLQGK